MLRIFFFSWSPCLPGKEIISGSQSLLLLTYWKFILGLRKHEAERIVYDWPKRRSIVEVAAKPGDAIHT